MNWWDVINGSYEVTGGVLVWLNVRRPMPARGVKRYVNELNKKIKEADENS